MKFKNAKEYISEFKKYLNVLLKDETKEQVYNIDSVLKLNNYDNFILIFKNNKIIDFANIYIKNNFKFISPNLNDKKNQNEELYFIKKKFPNFILETGNFKLNTEQNYYYKCIFNSRINKKFKYDIYNDANYYVSDIKKNGILRNNFEQKVFRKLNREKITFVNIKNSELELFLNKYSNGNKTWNDGSDWAIAGFHYFNLDEDENGNFLLCLSEKNVIAVIKHGIYEVYNKKFHCICYIDVNYAYREKGIAKIITNEMNNYLIDNLPVLLTNESNMGKKCHMHKLFKRTIKRKTYTYKEIEANL